MNKKYNLRKGFIIQVEKERITIFDGEESILYTFNETATIIFKKIKAGWNEKKILPFLIKRYKISEDQIIGDFNKFIKELKTMGIIGVK